MIGCNRPSKQARAASESASKTRRKRFGLAALVATGLALLSEELPFDVARYHRPQTVSHLNALSATDLAAELHHRLHVSPGVLSNLSKLASDLPARVDKLEGAPCTHCLVANAQRLACEHEAIK